jgi:hypothetical protein
MSTVRTTSVVSIVFLLDALVLISQEEDSWLSQNCQREVNFLAVFEDRSAENERIVVLLGNEHRRVDGRRISKHWIVIGL